LFSIKGTYHSVVYYLATTPGLNEERMNDGIGNKKPSLQKLKEKRER
jgi:hypothetical protein